LATSVIIKFSAVSSSHCSIPVLWFPGEQNDIKCTKRHKTLAVYDMYV